MAELDLDLCFETAVKLAKKSGEIVNEVLNAKKEYETKLGATDLVTETDHKVEKFIFSELKKIFPEHKFIGEESASLTGEVLELTNDPTWIVDPVDGTMNFVHSLPFVAVSIALVVNKKTEIAVVNAVGEQRLYTARKGQGAFCGDEKISVSKVDDISEAMVVCELIPNPKPTDGNISLRNAHSIFKQAHHVRVVGSCVVGSCLVASGKADAFFHFTLHCWDVAAVSLLITEAGGVVMDPMGSSFDMMSHRILVASSENLALQISELILDIPFKFA